ncbi:MAG: hypothetical protein WCS96_15105, partial [Victivallales bacterium]
MGKVSYPGIRKLLVLIRTLPAGFELTLDTAANNTILARITKLWGRLLDPAQHFNSSFCCSVSTISFFGR